MWMDFTLEKLAKLYISEIVRLHGLPDLIILDRDPCFTSRFWRALHEALGTRLHFSTAFHLHTNELKGRKIVGQKLVRETEDKVQTIQDNLRVAFDRQKSYADLKRKEIKFAVGDKLFLKFSPWRKVLRFGHKGKLSPRRYHSDPSHIFPFEQIEVSPDLSYE
ncbi:uncharacterized protein [Gossypium hirsutum]|uniref:Reverse transcriptase domain-containing protein n=1 Tax=Gossypium hirsutum TaxID=3635 RepID=A0ABM2ZNL2_GOSHI|nr:uncharacterized protein LOC121214523 [Gossypium hirsutum]